MVVTGASLGLEVLDDRLEGLVERSFRRDRERETLGATRMGVLAHDEDERVIRPEVAKKLEDAAGFGSESGCVRLRLLEGGPSGAHQVVFVEEG
jgi:hypothetical protein